VFEPSDAAALVMDVFTAYLQLMEAIQLTYWLEPAGSKGSWGLDDYQFLCFLWGSSQLINHPSFLPSIVLTPASITHYSDSFLYFRAILFILQYKTGPFHEHSALLHSVASLPSWSKANAGLIKMYEEEVMNKYPIVQHIKFGSLLRMEKYVEGTSRLGVERTEARGRGQARGERRAATERTAPAPPVPKFDES